MKKNDTDIGEWADWMDLLVKEERDGWRDE